MQDQFVGMFQEEWRDSEEYERRQEEIEMEHMDPESYLSCEPVAVSKSQVPSPRCSPPPPDDGGDPYGGSMDCHVLDFDIHDADSTPRPREPPRVRVALRVHFGRSVEVNLRLPKIDYENDYEQMCEQELARQERISRITGRPWHEVPEGAVLPWHWTEDLGRDCSTWRLETVTRVERVQQRREPPPHRDDPAYGPRASNPQGDERFRADRRAWFESVTCESLEGVDLTEQWQRVHRVARAFRADTRVSRRRWDFYCDDV